MQRMRWMAQRSGLAIALAVAASLTLLVAGDSPAKSSKEGYLGVTLQDLDDELRTSYGLRGTDGVLISEVQAEGPAEQAGVRRGDVLVRLGGTSVGSSADVIERVRGMEPGEVAIVNVWRDGREQTYRITLGERPGGPSAPRGRIIEVEGDEDEEDRDEEDGDHGDVHVYRWKDGGDWHEMDLGDLPTPEAFEHLGHGFAMLAGGRGRLGVRTQDVEGQLGNYFQAPGGKGVLVTEVIDDTPASKAGLAAGDLIVAVEGKPVETSSELRRALAEREEGPARLEVLRKGGRSTLTAQLEKPKQAEVFSLREVPRAYRFRTAPPALERYDAPRVRRQTEREMERLRRELRDLEREMEELREELRED